MSFTIEFHVDLAKEINEAKSWYEGEQSGLGAEFEAELFERFEFVRANPRFSRFFRRTFALSA